MEQFRFCPRCNKETRHKVTSCIECKQKWEKAVDFFSNTFDWRKVNLDTLGEIKQIIQKQKAK